VNSSPANSRAPNLFALRVLAPALVLGSIALAQANCSDSQSVLCPPGSQQAGVFSTTLSFNTTDPNQCYYGDGGSPPDASLSASPAAFTSAICSGFGIDGGPVVYLALPAFDRESDLGAGGTFTFGATGSDGGPLIVTGTSCGCNVAVVETITGTLTPSTPGSPITVNADGGLSPISGFSGTVVDQIADGDDAGSNCTCNLPCDLQYALSGVPL
jgi:hypothetical protein